MAAYSTHEVYDEHEYFIKFKNIHPYIYHSKNEYTIKKREFQIKLLENFKNNIITEEQFKDIYKIVIIKENNKYDHLERIKSEQKKIIENESKEIDNEIINYMDFII